MALVKNDAETVAFAPLNSLEEAIKTYNKVEDFDHKSYAVASIIKFEGGPQFLVSALKDQDTAKNISAYIAAELGQLDPKTAPVEEVMELLKLQNAYVRNLGISVLQNYGDAIKYYIVKFLIGDDKDLRIFAVNVLGDVNFAESRDMLLELLETEKDINVAMTAVDYMAEIGQPEDIEKLSAIKARFDDEPYVVFAIDRAITCIKGE